MIGLDVSFGVQFSDSANDTAKEAPVKKAKTIRISFELAVLNNLHNNEEEADLTTRKRTIIALSLDAKDSSFDGIKKTKHTSFEEEQDEDFVGELEASMQWLDIDEDMQSSSSIEEDYEEEEWEQDNDQEQSPLGALANVDRPHNARSLYANTLRNITSSVINQD